MSRTRHRPTNDVIYFTGRFCNNNMPNLLRPSISSSGRFLSDALANIRPRSVSSRVGLLAEKVQHSFRRILKSGPLGYWCLFDWPRGAMLEMGSEGSGPCCLSICIDLRSTKVWPPPLHPHTYPSSFQPCRLSTSSCK